MIPDRPKGIKQGNPRQRRIPKASQRAQLKLAATGGGRDIAMRGALVVSGCRRSDSAKSTILKKSPCVCSGPSTAKTATSTGAAKAGRYRWRGEIVMRWGRLG